jgi:3-hydroxy-3-methylglutaryl CoA synthase
MIFGAMGWLNAGNFGLARGEKAVANFDEDSLTMAVAAGVDCLNGVDRAQVGGLYFASTTMPFSERQSAGVIAGALGLGDDIRSMDFSGALKAGTAAIISAVEAVESNRVNNVLVCSADNRLGRMGSPQEMIFGDAAAAFLIGSDNVLAEFKGSHSLTYDFVDHFRGRTSIFDRQWEDRWIRDLGYDQFIPSVVEGLLKKYDMKITDFSKVIYPCYYPAERRKLNKMLGLSDEQHQDDMLGEIGEAGAAQPLVMFARALEEAKPGDKLLLVSFGNGCDAISFEATDAISNGAAGIGVSGYLAKKKELDNYSKYLAWRHIAPVDIGLRGEEDTWTRWSLSWRMRKAILGLCGTKCKKCGTPQFPPQRICVNPECSAVDEMEDFYFADKTGKIFSYTGDNLAASFNPPSIYGNIEFDVGGRYMFNFTDCDLDMLEVGKPVSFSFRIKHYDENRDITRYFWKAVPIEEGGAK